MGKQCPGTGEFCTDLACSAGKCEHERQVKIAAQRANPLQMLVTIPFECEPYVHDIRRFMDAMLYKIKKNAHKGRWQDLSVGEALELLRVEVRELEEAIKDGNRIEIELEAADVANFALIVSAIVIERGK